MSPVFEIRGMSLERGGKQVLDDVSITVETGEIVALLGANGAGKSSLVLGAAGALPLTNGEIVVGGAPLAGKTPFEIRSAGVAAVPEGHHVLTDLTVHENLIVAAATLPEVETETGVARAFSTFPELAERKGQAAGSLSGGQQQMLALGQALVGKPKIILADEMSLGLAPVIVSRLLDVLRDLAEQGTAVLLIEQYTELALGLASKVYVMERGRVIFNGTTEEIQADRTILHEAYLSKTS